MSPDVFCPFIRDADFAARAGLSPSRFQAVFKQRFGTLPTRYLLLMCGFADVHHFAKVFKKVTCKTPGQARREKRGA